MPCSCTRRQVHHVCRQQLTSSCERSRCPTRAYQGGRYWVIQPDRNSFTCRRLHGLLHRLASTSSRHQEFLVRLYGRHSLGNAAIGAKCTIAVSNFYADAGKVVCRRATFNFTSTAGILVRTSPMVQAVLPQPRHSGLTNLSFAVTFSTAIVPKPTTLLTDNIDFTLHSYLSKG